MLIEVNKINDNYSVELNKELENNKEVTIDASTYSAPIEIVPTAGNDAMKKCTVSLENVPSGGGNFTPFGCYINDHEPSYIGIFPHGSMYAHKIYVQGKLYDNTQVYAGVYTTLAARYAGNELFNTAGNNDLNVYSISYGFIYSYYLPIEPVGTENPSSEGWYEQYDNGGTLELQPASDTAVAAGKTYYKDFNNNAGNGLLYIVFELNNKYYGLVTAGLYELGGEDILIEIPSQQGE